VATECFVRELPRRLHSFDYYRSEAAQLCAQLRRSCFGARLSAGASPVIMVSAAAGSALAGFIPLLRCNAAFRRSSGRAWGWLRVDMGPVSAGTASSSSCDREARNSTSQSRASSIPDLPSRFFWNTMAAAETAQEMANWFTPGVSTRQAGLFRLFSPQPYFWRGRFRGRGGRNRTCDPQLRRLMLYPTELRPHVRLFSLVE
jgi:hypothetical protein